MVISRLSLSPLLKAASLSALLCTAITLAPTSYAADNQQEVQAGVKVSFAELDLDKAAGVDALYTRLKKAAEQVCGLNVRLSYAVTVQSASDRYRCYTDALDRAVTSIDLPSLTEKHAG